MPYIPTTDAERAAMLQTIGVSSIDELFADIPDDLRFRGRLNLPHALSEAETLQHLKDLAARNITTDDYVYFLGAGAYDHLIPAAVDYILARGEFQTAYTPYQAEISQGVLQAMYEYQSLICMLTGLDVANASLYDGASGVAEACIMAAAATGRGNVVISAGVHPEYRRVAETYLRHQGIEVRVAPLREGLSDAAAVRELIDGETAAVCLQQPNAFGLIEDMEPFGELAKGAGALFISVVDPISLAILKPPGLYGADIAVGEGQPLGVPLSFGGPYVGFIATREKLLRRLPGRIVGKTTDAEGRRGFVLTLQAREQHIRRERAASNICTNQALIALRATVYMALLGKEGLRQVAVQCVQKAAYAQRRLLALPGWSAPFRGRFFKEFVVRPPIDPVELNEALLEHKIVGGLPLGRWDPELADSMLLCVTEARTKDQIDGLVSAAARIVEQKGGARP